MSHSKSLWLWCLWLMCTGVSAKESVTGTLQDLADQTVQVEPQPLQNVNSEQVMQEYRRLLELEDVAPQLRIEAMRRLGDLVMEVSEDNVANGSTDVVGTAQVVEAIKLYEALLAAFPDDSQADEVMYQLAHAYEVTFKPDKTLAILERLIAHYPHSRWWVEAQFRRGEILFSKRRYDDSQHAYAAVVAAGEATGFYEQGLYKQGWSLFQLGRTQASANAFLKLLDRLLVKDAALRPLDSLTRPEHELVDDTAHAIAALCLEIKGADTLGTLLASHGEPPYMYWLYENLGELYLAKERYQDAAQTFTVFAQHRADSIFAPTLQVRAIEAYVKGGFQSRVLEAKQAFVEMYAFDSKFWVQRTPAEAPEVAQLLKTNLQDLAQYYHAQARQRKQASDYTAGIRWYRALLTFFPDDAAVPEQSYLLAELLFDSSQFAEATKVYEHVAYDYPQYERAANAGFAALAAYQRHEATLADAERTTWHRKFIDSEVMFATSFPEHVEAGRVLAKAAEDLFALNEFDRTIEIARQFLERKPPLDGKQQRVVTILLAHALFDREHYAEAEAAYLQARTLLPQNDPDLVSINERIAAAIYKQAEAKQAAGDAQAAIGNFLRAVSLAPTAQVSANAQFDAATILINQGDWPGAIKLLEQFRSKYPTHELAPEVTRELAVGYQEIGRNVDAAMEYERIAARKEEIVEIRRAALWQAAELYRHGMSKGRQEVAARATATYAQYVAQFPQPLDAAMDARQHLADLAVLAHDATTQRHWLQEIIKADKAAGTARTARSQYLAARATLSLVTPFVTQFEAIKLRLPLAKSLKQKRAAMEQVLKAYGQALEYDVAEVTTAATYGMAKLYWHMGAEVLHSERPKNLDADALEQYDVLLEEQAYPFEEKSIALHETNVQRASEGIYDEAVKNSFAALAQLVPARYAKTEISEDYVR